MNSILSAVLFGVCCVLVAVQSQRQSARSAISSALLRSIIQEEDCEVRPNSDIGGPTVWINMHLIGLEKLKERTNVLQAGLSVDLRWNDPRLSWDPEEYGNISNIFLPIKKIWIPDITIWQSADPTKPFFSNEQKLAQVFSTGDVLWAPKAAITVYSDMSVNNVSGSTEHRATAYLGSWMLNVGQIDIQSSQPIIDLTMMHWSPLHLENTSVTRVVQVFNEIPGFNGYPLLQLNIFATERDNSSKSVIM